MPFRIDHNSMLPLHYQVEELLRNLIESPEYKSGQFLPGEVELSKKLGVSRNTIRQATNKLEYEGLITRKKGYGTKVAENTVNTRLDNWHSFTQEMNQQGISYINYLVRAEMVECDEKVSGFFNIPLKQEVVKLSRLRGDDHGPFVYFESYFHPRIGVSLQEDFSQPLYQMLEEKYQTIVTVSRERIKARPANAITAKLLKIEKDEPVLIRERFVSGPGEKPVEYNIGFYVAQKFTYSIEIRR